MSANETNGRVTNADLYRAIDDVKELIEEKLARLGDRVGHLEVSLSHNRQWRLTLIPVLAGCLMSGVITAVIYSFLV